MNFFSLFCNKFFPVYVLFKKELTYFFIYPVFYAAAIVFILGTAIPFIGTNYWLSAGLSDLKVFFLNIPVVLSLIIPMLTMNLWAEEKKQNTEKLLFSLPISNRTIVAGKYFAALTVWLVILILSLPIPLSVFALGNFDKGSFFLSYAAVFFFGCGVIACTCAMSYVCKHTALNFLLSFIVIIFFTFIHLAAEAFTGTPQKIISYLSFAAHFDSAARGIFDSRDFVFYFMLILTGFELNVMILESKRNAV